MEGLNFKERAREEADDATQNCGEYTHLCSKWYLRGAEWGFRQAVEELRSKDAPTEMHRPYPYNHAWADWLLEKAGMDE